MLRAVARNQCRTDFLRLERRHLLVQSADTFPLGVVQHRQVAGAGNVVFGEFARGTDVDDLIEGRKVGYGGRQTGLNFQRGAKDTIRSLPLSHGHGRGCKIVFAGLRVFWKWITGMSWRTAGLSRCSQDKHTTTRAHDAPASVDFYTTFRVAALRSSARRLTTLRRSVMI